MNRRCSLLVLTVCILMATTPALAAALPSVVVTEPAPGKVLTTSEVVVRGTAQGSVGIWAQKGATDFITGTLEGVVLSAGDIALDNGVVDGFDDNSLDTTLWDRYQTGGLTTVEEDYVLHQYGRQSASDYWTGRTHVITKQPVGGMCEAHLAVCSGTGSGWGVSLALYQDDGNQVGFGINYDPGAWGGGIWVVWGMVKGGSQTVRALSLAVGTAHTIKLVQRGGAIDLYLDGLVKDTLSITLTNAKGKLSSSTRYNGDTVDAQWDDFRGGYLTSGTYVSEVHDTRAVDPVLRRVDWNATAPAGTDVRIDVRSCDTYDMATPTEWTTVTNGQDTDLPSARRYLQYRAVLTGTGAMTPSLRDVTIAYHKPVRRVEVSVDLQATWTPASGTTSWSVQLSLPEGTSTVWVRATDVAGDRNTTSLVVDVDTTPPAGTVLINKGDACTEKREVELTFDATDRCGVADMMYSESPLFIGAEWTTYRRGILHTLALGDGNKTVYAKFRDVNGWESAVASDSIVLDTSPPVGFLTIEGGAAYTNSTSVALSLGASDLTGVPEMRVGGSEDLSGAAWMAYSPDLEWQLPPGDGPKAVYASFRDRFGHVSAVVGDSIVLDTTPPVVTLEVNDGARLTGARDVAVRLSFVEANSLDGLQLGESPDLSTVAWQPIGDVPPVAMTARLSPGDGPKALYARARDAAGNVGPIASASIVLDTTAPVATVSPLPAKTGTTSFEVGWNATDATSEVVSYDLQSRDGDSPWTDWLTGTCSTTAVFAGADGHSYMFRARARDTAGNLGAFPDVGTGPVRVLVPVVSVTIDQPLDGARLAERMTAGGTASHTDADIGVQVVEVSVDGGPWQPATGTTSWSFELDLRDIADGAHTLRVRTGDGERWSAESSVTFEVDNPSPTTALSSWLIVILVVALVAAGIGAYIWMRSRRSP